MKTLQIQFSINVVNVKLSVRNETLQLLIVISKLYAVFPACNIFVRYQRLNGICLSQCIMINDKNKQLGMKL